MCVCVYSPNVANVASLPERGRTTRKDEAAQAARRMGWVEREVVLSSTGG